MRLAFFWVGQDTRIPQVLVSSVRAVYGGSLEVVQLTDLETPEVDGVSWVQRRSLDPHIMVARLQSYAALTLQNDYTFFCDADSILIAPLVLPSFDKPVLLTPRIHDGVINADFPEHYPEFVGKTLGAAMPFMFGAIAARDGANIFHELVATCKGLPLRFHRWYGDQVSLKAYVDRHPREFGLLDPHQHLCVIRQGFRQDLFVGLRAQNVQLVTFKGPAAKLVLFDWWQGIQGRVAPAQQNTLQ